MTRRYTRRYKCTICGMEFDTLRELVWHFESSHARLAWWLHARRVGYWRIYRYLRDQGWARIVK